VLKAIILLAGPPLDRRRSVVGADFEVERLGFDWDFDGEGKVRQWKNDYLFHLVLAQVIEIVADC
jgi:hypothetical protein